MKRLQTFMIYLLIIVGFFLVSVFLEGQLFKQMYANFYGSVDESFEYNGKVLDLDIEVLEAKASRWNGNITAKVTNNTSELLDKVYLKMELFANQDLKAITRYLEIENLKPGESRNYTLKFRAGYVDTYKVAISNEFPDKDYIFEIFNYEINTKNIMGLDLSRFINAKGIKEAGFNGITSVFSFIGMAGHRFVVVAKSVPLWGYVGALAILAGII